MPGVDRFVVETEFVVEVRAGRAAGRADVGEELASGDGVADRNVDLRKVAVACRQAAAVVDLDHVAVAARPTGFEDGAASGCVNLFAALAVNVHARMKLIRASAKRIASKAKFVVEIELGPGLVKVNA